MTTSLRGRGLAALTLAALTAGACKTTNRDASVLRNDNGQAARSVFDEGTARDDLPSIRQMARLTSAVYGWEERTGAVRNAPAELQNLTALVHGDLLAYYGTIGQSAVVIFRGSANVGNWLRNINFHGVRSDDIIGGGENAYLHPGFRNGAVDFANSLRDWARAQQTANRRLFVGGHSLGGAVGQIFTAILRHAGIAVRATYTFGAPKVGNQEGVDRIDNLAWIYRFYHWDDPVTGVPLHCRTNAPVGHFNVPVGVWLYKRSSQEVNAETGQRGLPNFGVRTNINRHSIDLYGVNMNRLNGFRLDGPLPSEQPVEEDGDTPPQDRPVVEVKGDATQGTDDSTVCSSSATGEWKEMSPSEIKRLSAAFSSP